MKGEGASYAFPVSPARRCSTKYFNAFFGVSLVIIKRGLFKEAHKILPLCFLLLAVPCEMTEQVYERAEAEILVPFHRVLVFVVVRLDVEEVAIDAIDSLFYLTVDFELHAVGIALHVAVDSEVHVLILDSCVVGKGLSLFFDIVENLFGFLLGLSDWEKPCEGVPCEGVMGFVNFLIYSISLSDGPTVCPRCPPGMGTLGHGGGGD